MKLKFAFICSLLCLIGCVKGWATCEEYSAPCQPAPYVSLFGGTNWDQYPYHTGADFKTGYIAGGSVGYRFEVPVRVELEVSYRHNKLDHLRHEGKNYHLRAYSQTWAFMSNGLYDFALCPWLDLSVGGGLGYAQKKIEVHEEAKKHVHRFAWQGLASLSTPLTESLRLGLDYRCFFVNQVKGQEQSVALSLKHLF